MFIPAHVCNSVCVRVCVCAWMYVMRVYMCAHVVCMSMCTGVHTYVYSVYNYVRMYVCYANFPSASPVIPYHMHSCV